MAGKRLREDESETGGVPACPECDSSFTFSRSKSIRSGIPEDAPKHVCYECGNEFDEPRMRENRGNTSAGETHPGGRALAKADPEEWP